MTDPMKQVKSILDNAIESAKRARFEDDRRRLMSTVGQDVAKMLAPVLANIASTSKTNKQDLREAMMELLGEVANMENVQRGIDTAPIIQAIEESFGRIDIPQPKVQVNVPDIKIPDIKMPEEMSVRGWVSLMGVDLDNPLPVQLRDAKGNPVNLFENLTQIVNGGGAGAAKIVKVSGFGASAFAEITNPDGRVRVELPTGSSGLTDTELRASALPVIQATGSVNSVNVLQIAGNPAVVGTGYQDNALRVVIATDAIASVKVTGFDASVAASLVDSGGVQYSGSNPVPVGGNVNVNGTTNSVVATGVTLHDAADEGDAPLKMGGVAVQTNPAAVADGDRVRFTSDDLGRQLVRPVQVRDLLKTAYVSITNGSETTLLAGVAGVFFDLVYVMGTNNSDAAVTVDLRSATGGGIVTSIRIPANGTAGVSLSVPLPQDTAADTWTADLPDITGTTVTISALFSREV